jgi:hypothetical protein
MGEREGQMEDGRPLALLAREMGEFENPMGEREDQMEDGSVERPTITRFPYPMKPAVVGGSASDRCPIVSLYAESRLCTHRATSCCHFDL